MNNQPGNIFGNIEQSKSTPKQLGAFANSSNQGMKPQSIIPKNNKETKSAIGKIPTKFKIGLLGMLLIFSIIGYLVYTYTNTLNENKLLREQVGSVAGANIAKEEYDSIRESVINLVDIDLNERINIARIDDTTPLMEQNPSFYESARVGHYLIVMPESQRVLVFDRDRNRIVNFSSYTIRVDLIPEDQISDDQKPLLIELRYTTDVDFETLEQVKASLGNASPNYRIVDTLITNNSYQGLTLVLLNRDAKPDMSQNLIAHAGTNNIKDTMPTGESASSADAVIILGSF